MIAKFRLNIETGEVEISGQEEFVKEQVKELKTIINLVKELQDSNYERGKDFDLEGKFNDEISYTEDEQSGDIPDTFGEWYAKFKNDLKESDKVLIAAYYIQNNSDDKEFKTAEITEILKDHGIVVANTSTYVKRLIEGRLMFQTKKDKNERYMRVSEEGVKYLRELE